MVNDSISNVINFGDAPLAEHSTENIQILGSFTQGKGWTRFDR
jgi:hypothetical protein